MNPFLFLAVISQFVFNVNSAFGGIAAVDPITEARRERFRLGSTATVDDLRVDKAWTVNCRDATAYTDSESANLRRFVARRPSEGVYTLERIEEKERKWNPRPWTAYDGNVHASSKNIVHRFNLTESGYDEVGRVYCTILYATVFRRDSATSALVSETSMQLVPQKDQRSCEELFMPGPLDASVATALSGDWSTHSYCIYEPETN